MHGIGIIGLGVMGRRFAAAALEHPRLRLVAAYDPDVGADFASIPRAVDAGAVIDHPEVGCVYIASPPATHLELIQRSARAGKAIFCEKPLCTVPADALAAVHAIEEAGVLAAVNFPHATAPAALELQRLVRTGELGRRLDARLTLRFAQWPRQWQADAGEWLRSPAEGGFTREVVSHFLFLALRLFGSGRLRQHEVSWGRSTETALRCTVEFAEALLTIDGAVQGDNEDQNAFEVYGDRAGALLFDWYNLSFGPHHIAAQPVMPAQLAELTAMLDGQQHCLATFDEACRVVQLVESILHKPARPAQVHRIPAACHD